MTLISISLYPRIKKRTSTNLHPCNTLQVQIHSRYKGDINRINAHGKKKFFFNSSLVFELTIALEQPITFNKNDCLRNGDTLSQWSNEIFVERKFYSLFPRVESIEVFWRQLLGKNRNHSFCIKQNIQNHVKPLWRSFLQG